MSDETIETVLPGGSPVYEETGTVDQSPEQPGNVTRRRDRPARSGRQRGRVDPGILRAVKVSFAVASADRDVLGVLAAITGAGSADAETVAVAVAAGAAGESGLLADVLNLPAAGPADGMRVAISVASAGRDAQRELWSALTRLGFAVGKASPNPEELSLAIVQAGQGIPERKHPVLSAALDILADGREG